MTDIRSGGDWVGERDDMIRDDRYRQSAVESPPCPFMCGGELDAERVCVCAGLSNPPSGPRSRPRWPCREVKGERVGRCVVCKWWHPAYWPPLAPTYAREVIG